ncbi:MAG: purine nucleoside permease [Gammaproteobacteria bacterium]|jgi:purine nucleoside permease
MIERFMPYISIFLLTVCQLTSAQQATPERIPVKVVVLTMFEKGEDVADRPGEFQNWVEKLPLAQSMPFPQGYRDLRYSDRGILGVVTGMGIAKAAASTMAIGLDTRFDLSKAYWIIAGIAGVDPEDASLGSAVWAEWVIDGDLSHQIDTREVPSAWTTGYIPLRQAEPYELPVPENNEGAVYRLNADLVEWAYQLTKNVKLKDNGKIKQQRELYTDHIKGQVPPFVLKGDHLAASTYWHGALLNQWANDWVHYWSEGNGNFVTSGMEDTGTLQSLTFLGNAGKVDINRVLVLRTASNYTVQYPGITASQSLRETVKGKGYSAYVPALDAAYEVGSVVVNELVNNWVKYKDMPPGKVTR